MNCSLRPDSTPISVSSRKTMFKPGCILCFKKKKHALRTSIGDVKICGGFRSRWWSAQLWARDSAACTLVARRTQQFSPMATLSWDKIGFIIASSLLESSVLSPHQHQNQAIRPQARAHACSVDVQSDEDRQGCRPTQATPAHEGQEGDASEKSHESVQGKQIDEGREG